MVRSPFRRLTFNVKDSGYVGFICEALLYGMMVSLTQGINNWEDMPYLWVMGGIKLTIGRLINSTKGKSVLLNLIFVGEIHS